MACSDQLTTQDLENAKKYVEDMATFNYSDELTFIDFDGAQKDTAKGLAAKYTMSTIGDGVWISGAVFTGYNQYLVYSGTAYRLNTSVATPYTVGATPDLSFVKPFSDTGQVDSNTDSILAINTLTNLSQQSLTAAQQGERLSKGETLKVYCAGDSTMYGFTALTGVQSPFNAPASLSTAMSSLFTGNSIVNNIAISGTTMRGMLAGTDGSGSTFESKLNGGILSNADIIYCNHGINDSQLDLSINQYRLDVIEFVSLCRSYGSTPILVTPNPNNPIDIIDSTKSKRLGLYVNIMREVAVLTSCDLVDQDYYFRQSANVFNMQDIVPDGAHLTDDGYRQAGYNLLIPLISVNTLYNNGDKCGLSGTTWFDSLTTSRNIQRQDSSNGASLTAECLGGVQGINFPVIFDKGQTEITPNTLQYSDTVNLNATVNGINCGKFFNQRLIGNTGHNDWNSDFSITKNVYAGLNIVGLLCDSVPTGGSFFIFSGLGISDEKGSYRSKRFPSYADNPPIKNGDTVIFDANFSSGTGVEFADSSGTKAFSIISYAGIIKLQTWANGVVSQESDLSASVIPDGVYPAQIEIFNGNINVSVSGIGTSIAIDSVPNTYISTPYISYSIV